MQIIAFIGYVCYISYIYIYIYAFRQTLLSKATYIAFKSFLSALDKSIFIYFLVFMSTQKTSIFL